MGRVKNYFFCKKYPFWKLKNVWTNEFMGYEYTWYDEIPEGWRKAFGKQLSDEILAAGKAYLKEHKDKTWDDVIHWEQIKEKFGELRLYASAIDEIDKILIRYELLSRCYCEDCGKPARYATNGYVVYMCEDCAKKQPPESIHRLKESDIPKSSRLNETIIKKDLFLSEKKCDEFIAHYKEEDAKANPPHEIVYRKIDKGLGVWMLEHVKREWVAVDYKKEYDIDFKEKWGIK